ncbi:hypothetical protein [Micromonospora sp. WMMA1947]|nr:hypothetical protein [Micromonospora sp. WMMA1947]WBC11099.1 hypothetical protein O7604_09590 [Micromonospora sp. WMMA1947]
MTNRTPNAANFMINASNGEGEGLARVLREGSAGGWQVADSGDG